MPCTCGEVEGLDHATWCPMYGGGTSDRPEIMKEIREIVGLPESPDGYLSRRELLHLLAWVKQKGN